MTVNDGWRGVVSVSVVAFVLAMSMERGETHKLISSKYTYNDDIFPIFQQHCGQCHVAEGVAPMSLMTFKDAYPWSESLRAELILGDMPPWNVRDDIGAFRNQPTITAPEIDRILTWASGGYPEGNPAKVPPAMTWRHEWPLGSPDLVLEPSSGFTLPGDESDATEVFTLPAHTAETRWLRAVDLLPGTAAIVRNATITIKAKASDPSNGSALETERVLARWVPGEIPVTAEHGTGFRLPAGAELVVRVHYKKTYGYDGKAMSDRSSVGLYFAQGPVTDIRCWTISSPIVTAAGGDRLTFSGTVEEDLDALAFSPDPALSNARLEVTAVSPGGLRTPVVHLAVRPDWTRRFWFGEPLALPRGTRIEVVLVVNGADGLLPPAASPIPRQSLTGSSVRVMFDVVPSEAPGQGARK